MAEGSSLLRELRIVMVGKTGSGKSSSVNTILGTNVCKVGGNTISVTKQCIKYSGEVDGTTVHVIDSPGLFDTETISNEELKSIIGECVKKSVPGPHAFLLVIRLGVRFTQEEQNAVKWIEDNFGEDASLYSIVLFTCKEQHPPEEAIRECKGIKRIVNKFGGRHLAFNNNNKHDRQQVRHLIEMIKKMVDDNDGKHYTHKMFEEAQQKLREEEEKREREEKKKKAEERQRWREEEKMRLGCVFIGLVLGALMFIGGITITAVPAVVEKIRLYVGVPLIVSGLVCIIVAFFVKYLCKGQCCKPTLGTVV